MNTMIYYKIRFLLFLLITSNFIQAQTTSKPNEICAEGDCSPTIFDIQLDEPLKPISGKADTKRTEQFKKAHQLLHQYKQTHALKPEWGFKYDGFQLGGHSCLRLYQLEGYLAFEYEQNPDFKKFIDQKETNVEAFKKRGFDSIHRGMNLRQRMQKQCSDEIKKLEKKKGLNKTDQSAIYTKLGEVQGYFDKDGNVLKSPPAPPTDSSTQTNKPSKKRSKKEQIAFLKNQLNTLPLTPDVGQKLGAITDALTAVKPKLGLLGGLFNGLKKRLAGLLSKPLAWLSKLGNLKKLHDALGAFKPKVPNTGLFNKLKNLFKKRDNLQKKVEDFASNSNKINDALDKVTQKIEKVKSDIDKRTSNANRLKKILGELLQRKKDLTERLEDKPKKYLDELTALVDNVKKETGKFLGQVDIEKDLKDKVLEGVEKLNQEKDKIEDKIKKLEELADIFKQTRGRIGGRNGAGIRRGRENQKRRG